jgi:hypothetical protein
MVIQFTFTVSHFFSSWHSSRRSLPNSTQSSYINSTCCSAIKIIRRAFFTRQQGNPDLQHFFADASLKYKANKWKIDFELNAVNFLNVKTYNALYFSANAFSASSYMLPGRIVVLKVLFNL